MPLPRVFLDFTVAETPLGRVVFELFSDVVPKTADNFRALCTGEVTRDGLQLTYKGSPVHRVIEGFMIQGGDFTKRNGSGGMSIYGGTFADERLEGDGTDVDQEGLLVMANRGPDTNGSQWFVTLAAAPHLTGKHVVFGRVVSGMEHIKTIGALRVDDRDRPLSPVIVSHCGELELRLPARARSPSRSRSLSRSVSPVSARDRDRSPRRRRSPSPSSSSSEERRRRRRERRREKEDRRDRKRDKDRRRRSVSETLSELDARLEREEKERLEEEERVRAQEAKAQVERQRQAIRDAGGVVYKGRGSMRYRDPESLPTNYNPRGQDTRARHRRGYGGDRWEHDGGRGGDSWGRDDRGRSDRAERGDRAGHERRGERRWDADRWERAAPTFERAADKWDMGRMGDGAAAAREGLADRLGRPAPDAGLNYAADEGEKSVDEGRYARASAWANARRASPSPPRRSVSPRRDSYSRSPVRGERVDRRSPGSDMELDRD